MWSTQNYTRPARHISRAILRGQVLGGSGVKPISVTRRGKLAKKTRSKNSSKEPRQGNAAESERGPKQRAAMGAATPSNDTGQQRQRGPK